MSVPAAALPAGVREAARAGRLYPAVIVHGGEEAARRAVALELARMVLCAAAPAARPCGACRHCRRIAWPGTDTPFHPDFQVLERDLKTATSVDATRELLRTAQVSPFEARGQVFAVASAESLSGEAANTLLKILEEPPASAPRHFLLLTPSRLDLLPTLRSRSLSIFLGPAEPADPEAVEGAARGFAGAVSAYAATGAAVYLLRAAEALALGAPKAWDDPRAGRPWATAAAAVLAAVREPSTPAALRRPLLALAEDLLAAPPWRLRGVPAERILEGLVARHLAAATPGR
jgi:DNA polymerase-3 subunit delta'